MNLEIERKIDMVFSNLQKYCLQSSSKIESYSKDKIITFKVLEKNNWK